MQKIYDQNFAAFDDEQKAAFVYSFSKLAEESFAEQPFSIEIQAQLLIFTRWWNSYRLMSPKDPTPEILEIAMDDLWDYQSGKIEPIEFARFTKNLSAAALDIMTGDDSELQSDPFCLEFYQIHFPSWPLFYNEFLTNLTTLFEEIVNHIITWEPIEAMLYGDIGDTMIEVFESVYTNPTGGYKPAELDRRDREIYRTETFCRVIALLQKDMRTALEKIPIEILRTRYQDQYLFTPEDCAKIT